VTVEEILKSCCTPLSIAGSGRSPFKAANEVLVEMNVLDQPTETVDGKHRHIDACRLSYNRGRTRHQRSILLGRKNMTTTKADGPVANRRQIIKGLAYGGAAAVIGMPYIARAQANDTIRIGYIDHGIRSNFGETAPCGGPGDHAGRRHRDRRQDLWRRDCGDSQSIPTAWAASAMNWCARKRRLAAGGRWPGSPRAGNLRPERHPAISTILQWEPFYASRSSSPEKGYPWSFLFFWSGADIIKNYAGMWDCLASTRSWVPSTRTTTLAAASPA
jgi:hypothetical protein